MSGELKNSPTCYSGAGGADPQSDCTNNFGVEWGYAHKNIGCKLKNAGPLNGLPGTAAVCRHNKYLGDKKTCCINKTDKVDKFRSCDKKYSKFETDDCDIYMQQHCENPANYMSDVCKDWKTQTVLNDRGSNGDKALQNYCDSGRDTGNCECYNIIHNKGGMKDAIDKKVSDLSKAAGISDTFLNIPVIEKYQVCQNTWNKKAEGAKSYAPRNLYIPSGAYDAVKNVKEWTVCTIDTDFNVTDNSYIGSINISNNCCDKLDSSKKDACVQVVKTDGYVKHGYIDHVFWYVSSTLQKNIFNKNVKMKEFYDNLSLQSKKIFTYTFIGLTVVFVLLLLHILWKPSQKQILIKNNHLGSDTIVKGSRNILNNNYYN